MGTAEGTVANFTVTAWLRGITQTTARCPHLGFWMGTSWLPVTCIVTVSTCSVEWYGQTPQSWSVGEEVQCLKTLILDYHWLRGHNVWQKRPVSQKLNYRNRRNCTPKCKYSSNLILCKGRTFFYLPLVPGPNQSPSPLAVGTPPGTKVSGVWSFPHLHLLPWLKMCETLAPLPHILSWCGVYVSTRVTTIHSTLCIFQNW
jgi:hypothetical protein